MQPRPTRRSKRRTSREERGRAERRGVHAAPLLNLQVLERFRVASELLCLVRRIDVELLPHPPPWASVINIKLPSAPVINPQAFCLVPDQSPSSALIYARLVLTRVAPSRCIPAIPSLRRRFLWVRIIVFEVCAWFLPSQCLAGLPRQRRASTQARHEIVFVQADAMEVLSGVEGPLLMWASHTCLVWQAAV
jgi:hypothetical protein